MGFRMIFGDFAKALAQRGDPRFLRVVLLGIALSFALLTGVYALFLWGLDVLVPDDLGLPFVGQVQGLSSLVSWGSALLMLGLSVFLMLPVAALISGLYLEDVADAVEDRHYPHLPPVTPPPLSQTLVQAVNFFGLLMAVNFFALFLFLFAGPLVPLLFYALNGWLLGREYFTLVAARRLGFDGARAMRRVYSGRIWLAGCLMAMPLSVPLVNLIIPVLGVATFTHLFHRLWRQS
jgi:CysZ protein